MIVEQWKSSSHFAAFVANLGGDEVPVWTGARTCGNCHAIDGIEQRVAGNVLFGGANGPANVTEGQINYLHSTTARVSEASYAGVATVAAVNCTSCHDAFAQNDPHLTGEIYVPGSFPLRVPSSATDEARLEKSSVIGTVDGTSGGTYGAGNACMWCHKSRKDVTNYIDPTTNNITSRHWGPHRGPHADVYTGKGGYHYAAATYGNSSHQAFETGCLECHMPKTANNQDIGNHSFYPQLSTCQQSGCHATATNFDIIGGQSSMKAGIQELREALDANGWLTRDESSPYGALSASALADDAYGEDHANPDNANALTADEAGAMYNYLLLASGSAGGIHNPVYTRQLLWDSIRAVTSANPTTLASRP